MDRLDCLEASREPICMFIVYENSNALRVSLEFFMNLTRKNVDKLSTKICDNLLVMWKHSYVNP